MRGGISRPQSAGRYARERLRVWAKVLDGKRQGAGRYAGRRSAAWWSAPVGALDAVGAVSADCRLAHCASASGQCRPVHLIDGLGSLGIYESLSLAEKCAGFRPLFMSACMEAWRQIGT